MNTGVENYANFYQGIFQNSECRLCVRSHCLHLEVSCIVSEDTELENERVCPPPHPPHLPTPHPALLKDHIRRLSLVAVSLGHVSNWMKIIPYQYNSIFLFFSFSDSSVVSLQSYYSFNPPMFIFIAKLLSLFQGYLCGHI